jgi:DNA repair photolyase
MKLQFDEYQTRKIVNAHKHVDGPWFWCRYTAHPYVGCRAGCEFCYSRGTRYLGRRDPGDFDTVIRVKVNAVERLRKELARLPKDVVTVGDWQQTAESRYRLSRGMLEVVRELGFPLFIVERSPLLTRDLDLLTEIHRDTSVAVAFSISSVDPALKKAFEPRSPGTRQRLKAMEKLASAGILVGTMLMPIIPLLGDDERHLDDTVRATKVHGGSFVMGAAMTMDGVQAERTLAAALRVDPGIEDRLRRLYAWEPGGAPSYGPPRAYASELALLVRELCTRHGLLDRLPRTIEPGPLSINKQLAEKLFIRVYDMELEQADSRRIWAYRRAAWTVDEMSQSIADLYRARGERGLRELPGIGAGLAGQITDWLQRHGVELDRGISNSQHSPASAD